MSIFLPHKCFSLFLYRIIDWIFKTIPVRKEGGQMGKGMCAKGVFVASVHVRVMGKRGQIFAILVCTLDYRIIVPPIINLFWDFPAPSHLLIFHNFEAMNL